MRKIHDELDEEEDMPQQRRAWKAERISWVLMFLLVAVAVFGFTGLGGLGMNWKKASGQAAATDFDFNADQWSARMTTKFKLPADIDFEVMGNYQSNYQTFQSEVSGFLFADLGLRKKLMGGRTILNLSVRDVFARRSFLWHSEVVFTER